MSPPLLVLAAAAGEAPPLGEAWIPHDPRFPVELPAGVGPAEGRRHGPDGTWVRVVVEPWAIDALRARTEVRDYDPDPAARRAPLPPGYHGPDDVLDLLDDLEPMLVRGGRLTVGWSSEGRPIDALWLGQPPDRGAPAIRVLGGHHGDELVSVEVAVAVTERLVLGDGGDPRVTALLDGATVWIVPVVNPDGVARRRRESATGVDLNRNYDYAWSADSVRPGDSPFSEPETRAIRALTLVDRPMLSVSLHAGEANLGWPWNYTVADPPDAVVFAALAEAYAADCGAPGFWVTQGADWYVTYGDTNDWAYGRHGTLDYTLEVSDDRAPPDPGAVVDWHVEAILGLLATPPTVSGRVTDARTGDPVEAAVAVEGSDRAAWSSPVTGTFHRVAPGAEALTVWAPGYAEARVPVGTEPVQVALDPVDLAPGGLTPSVLNAPGAVLAVGFDLGEAPVTLLQPGREAVEVRPVHGVLHLDPAALGPGWWTVRTADGAVRPRALLVENAEQVEVTGHVASDDRTEVTILAEPLSPGTRAWAVWGDRRRLVPLPVIAESPSEVTLDVAGVPSDEGPVDVMVHSGGAVLGIADLHRAGLRVGQDERDGVTGSRCGCAGTAAGLQGPTWGAASLLLVVASRRRRPARRVS